MNKKRVLKITNPSLGFAKGTIYLMTCSMIFLISGYVVNIGVGRYLGPEKYGIFGTVITLITIVNLAMTTGFPRGVSKYLSERKGWDKDLVKKSMGIQIGFSLILFCILIISAPIISQILNDNSLTYYIRFSALIIPAYALSSIFIDGYLNGYKLFKKQAITQVTFSLGKIVFVFLFLFIGFEVIGAIFGYLCGALVSSLVGFLFFKRVAYKRETEKINVFPMKKLIYFAMPVLLYHIFLFLIFNIDLISIKAILQQNIDVGYYTSATTIARIPYFLFGGLALSLLPNISYLSIKNDFKKIRDYITKSLRYMVMLLLPMILLISVTSKSLVILLYTNTYISAASPLQILIIGLGFFTVFNVFSYIAMGSGKPRVAFGITTIIFLIAFGLNILLIPLYGLAGAAFATTISSFVGLLVMTAFIYQYYKVLMNPVSFVRISVASLVVAIIAWFFPFTGYLIALEYIILFAIYLFILWITKEINQNDIETIRNIIPPNIL